MLSDPFNSHEWLVAPILGSVALETEQTLWNIFIIAKSSISAD